MGLFKPQRWETTPLLLAWMRPPLVSPSGRESAAILADGTLVVLRAPQADVAQIVRRPDDRDTSETLRSWTTDAQSLVSIRGLPTLPPAVVFPLISPDRMIRKMSAIRCGARGRAYMRSR